MVSGLALGASDSALQVGHVLAVAQVVGLVAGEADEFGLGEADLVGEVFEQFLGAAIIVGDGSSGQ
jgi:dsRNA-specific ribonuclease